MSQWTRDGIINAIIRDKYRQDEMEAITNNMAAINAVFMQTLVTDGIIAATKYLKDSINDDNTARFKEMQEWRKMAKEIAGSIIKD
jgi:nitrogenase subunit NifH